MEKKKKSAQEIALGQKWIEQIQNWLKKEAGLRYDADRRFELHDFVPTVNRTFNLRLDLVDLKPDVLDAIGLREGGSKKVELSGASFETSIREIAEKIAAKLSCSGQMTGP